MNTLFEGVFHLIDHMNMLTAQQTVTAVKFDSLALIR